ncbi:ABC transporter ATP-binding protein [Polycladidibacter hongkongensis]|uniref:ABC transporter ATP-binding protein n=1 Tax=Polycladidibacter hongkongensis TaxID=1647556 RepID=UPI0008316A02|nr:ABC transporter ATP-binding protein [Pseudovibrio hongkongensis]
MALVLRRDLPQDSSLALIRRIFSDNFREFAVKYAIAFGFMALVAATTSLSAWIMRDVVNEIFVAKDFSKLLQVTVAILVIFAVKGIASYGQVVTLSKVGNAIVAKNQRKMFAHILRQDSAFFNRHGASDLITRISHNAQAVREVINIIVTSFGRDLLSLIGLVSVMVIQDPLLSLVSLIIAPPAIYGVAYLVKRVRRLAHAEVLSLARIVQVMQETAAGIRIVQSFGIEPQMQSAMNGAVSGVEQRANKMAELGARTSPLMETLGGCAFALVIMYSGWQTIVSGKTPGEFISFLTALLLAYEPAKRLSRLQVTIETGLIGGRMMYEILDSPPKIVDAQNALPLDIQAGELKLTSIEFSYIPEQKVLKDLSVICEGGKVTALVGPSGGGKSTVFSIVQRLYDLQGGAVCIDGQDIRHVTLRSLRQNMSLVSQDTVLFTGSVRENIGFGRAEASDEEIEQAARDALAHDFICELPNGYKTLIGESGHTLSGGQKQRLAIARALLKNAKLVLLDEATSALDNETEAKLQVAMRRLMSGRTTLVIAHRLSTIRHADKICFLRNGAIIEQGSHEELIAQEGAYAALVNLQFSKAEDAASKSSATQVEAAHFG